MLSSGSKDLEDDTEAVNHPYLALVVSEASCRHQLIPFLPRDVHRAYFCISLHLSRGHLVFISAFQIELSHPVVIFIENIVPAFFQLFLLHGCEGSIYIHNVYFCLLFERVADFIKYSFRKKCRARNFATLDNGTASKRLTSPVVLRPIDPLLLFFIPFLQPIDNQASFLTHITPD